jgi:hypothetical protein
LKAYGMICALGIAMAIQGVTYLGVTVEIAYMNQ